MLRTVLAASAFAFVAAQPAFAQDAMMKCDEPSMMAVQKDIDAAADAMKKDTATKEMDMAKQAMQKNETDKCTMHLDAAMKAAKGM
jgi:hypothetical protein